MSSDLIEFLRARLDEDEQAASAASDGPWEAWRSGRVGGLGELEHAVTFPGQKPGSRAPIVAASWLDAEHIAHHDPARVLREVEAKRRIVELCSPPLVVCPSPTGETEYIPGEGEPWGQDALKLLALPYADHPDYREDWRP